MTSKNENKAIDLITNTITLFGIEKDQIKTELNNDIFNTQLQLPDDESGVFIGHQGETLNSLQLILSLMVSQRLGDWHRVKVNIGDYHQRREQQLINKADQAAQRALETGQEIIIPGLNSYERHLVHDHLSENKSISTVSRGDEPNRQLFVSPASK